MEGSTGTEWESGAKPGITGEGGLYLVVSRDWTLGILEAIRYGAEKGNERLDWF